MYTYSCMKTPLYKSRRRCTCQTCKRKGGRPLNPSSAAAPSARRDPQLPYEARVHSQGDRLPESKEEELDDPIKNRFKSQASAMLQPSPSPPLGSRKKRDLARLMRRNREQSRMRMQSSLSSPSPSPSDAQQLPDAQHLPEAQLAEAQLAEASEKNAKIRGEDYAFITAHGFLGNELSPTMKWLANKYLRVIEMGRAGYYLGVISPQVIAMKINNLMRDPENYAMFDNTREGETRRASAFAALCKDILNDGMASCGSADAGFRLVDITHERVLSGDADNSKIQKGHKITYLSIANGISRGVFLPVDYHNDSRYSMEKRQLFKLYPNTSFLGKQTTMNMMETLLPIAIRQNRRINVIVSACSGILTQGDDVYDNMLPVFTKPGIKNPAIAMLTTSKRYLSTLTKLMNAYFDTFYQINHRIVHFKHTVVNERNVFEGYTSYVADKKYDELYAIAKGVISFYQTEFQVFAGSYYSDMGRVEEAFSFALPNSLVVSNALIESANAQVLRSMWYRDYVNELIKVKIFLMDEFAVMFSARIDMIKFSLSVIVTNLSEYRRMYGNGPFTDPIIQGGCDALDIAVRYAMTMLDYFTRLSDIGNYIAAGLSANITPDSFADYKKYRDVREEYVKTGVKELLYEHLTEDMDYDRYEMVGDDQVGHAVSVKNPLSLNKFRKTARFPYKYKELPNYDDAIARRKTLKQQMYNGTQRVGRLARNAKRELDVSI